jgi:hypothetical protein
MAKLDFKMKSGSDRKWLNGMLVPPYLFCAEMEEAGSLRLDFNVIDT